MPFLVWTRPSAVSIEEVSVIEYLTAAGETNPGATGCPIGTDPLAPTAVPSHELHGCVGTCLPRPSYQLEGRVVVNGLVV
jgi:hypothetical protein